MYVAVHGSFSLTASDWRWWWYLRRCIIKQKKMADVPPCVAQVSHRSKLRERQKRMFCSDGLLYICPPGLQFLIKCRQRVHVFLPPDGVQTESTGTVDTLTTSVALTRGLALRKRKSCRTNRNESNNAISFFNCNCHCWCTICTYTYTYVHK